MSVDQQNSRSSTQHESSNLPKEKKLFPRGNRKKDLLDNVRRLNLDKEPVSDHRMNEGSSSLQPFKNHKKPWPGRKTENAEELVKNMSHVPSYLQHKKRGDNIQEKALSVGVLDWGLLERWAYHQKCATSGGDRSSTSINPLSSVSTFASSRRYSKASPNVSHEKRSSSKDLCKKLSSASKNQIPLTSKENSGDGIGFPGFNTSATDLSTCHDNYQDAGCDPRTETLRQKYNKDAPQDLDPNANKPESRCDEAKITKNYDAHDKNNLSEKAHKVKHSPNNVQLNCSMEKCSHYYKGVMDGFEVQVDCKQISSELENVEHVTDSCCGSSSTWIDQQRGTYRKSISKNDKDIHYIGQPPYIAHSCPLPCTSPTNESDDSLITLNFVYVNTECVGQDMSSNAKNDFSCHQFRVAQTQQSSQPIKNETPAPGGLAINRSNPKRMTISASSKECPSSENLNSNDFLHGSTGDTTNDQNKSRRSPLRRIIDPLLKLKDGRRSSQSIAAMPKRHSYEPSKSDRALICEEIGLSFGLRKSSCTSVDSTNQVNMNISGHLPNTKGGSQHDVRHGTSARQALLQISWKNGLPLFMLSSCDNEVFAATTEHISKNSDLECQYTIFSVDKSRKKGISWGNSGNNCRKNQFSSVSKLKVSLHKLNNISDGHHISRKIVLYGAKLVPTEEKLVDSAPNNELAAFIINGTKETMQNTCAGTSSGRNCGLSSLAKQTEPSTVYTEKESQSDQPGSNRWVGGFVAILPRGIHGLSTEGNPSSLIERWQSGGACDCGGWDEGCELTVLCDNFGDHSNYSSAKDHQTVDMDHKFQLFVQGATSEGSFAFRMVSFKEGLYTVKFKSSIASLQAFAICIAYLHTMKHNNNDSGQRKSLHEHIVDDDEKRGYRGGRMNYIPYHPPLSPVGRA